MYRSPIVLERTRKSKEKTYLRGEERWVVPMDDLSPCVCTDPKRRRSRYKKNQKRKQETDRQRRRNSMNFKCGIKCGGGKVVNG